mmetsp:Transcript_33948/g.104809  ORF Transcript_33948/g.104809 Transcript_33948/m.104809 type:complete len:214 (-) Transcript_33948:135-776(-)
MLVLAELRESEVVHLDIAVAVEQDVLRLQVAVRHLLVVAVPDGEDDLLEDLAREHLRELAALADEREELPALDVFEHEVDGLLRLQDVLQAHDVLVVERLQQRDLALHLRLEIAAEDEFLGDDLDRVPLLGLGVDAEAHRGEAPLPELLVQVVLAHTLHRQLRRVGRRRRHSSLSCCWRKGETLTVKSQGTQQTMAECAPQTEHFTPSKQKVS